MAHLSSSVQGFRVFPESSFWSVQTNGNQVGGSGIAFELYTWFCISIMPEGKPIVLCKWIYQPCFWGVIGGYSPFLSEPAPCCFSLSMPDVSFRHEERDPLVQIVFFMVCFENNCFPW